MAKNGKAETCFWNKHVKCSRTCQEVVLLRRHLITIIVVFGRIRKQKIWEEKYSLEIVDVL